MTSITIRNLPEATHRALKQCAARRGWSIEAEVSSIVEEAVHPKGRVKIGSELAAIGRRFKGIDLDIERDQTPTEPAKIG